MERAAPYLILIGRVLLSIIFIQAGWGKIFGYAGTVEHMQAAGVPGALLPLVILDRARRRALVLLGLFTRWAAIALAGFCVLAGYLFHYQPGDMVQMISFMKNITIAGGFLVLAGSGPGALRARQSAQLVAGVCAWRRRHPPHDVADIVGDQERAGTIDGDAGRAALRLAWSLRKPVSTSTGWPEGFPSANGTNTTL